MELTAEITALASDGSGIGPITGPASDIVGKKVTVPGTIPGEIVVLTLQEQSSESRLAHGTLVNIRAPHPSRRHPPCPYVPDCGGCALQHCGAQKQRESKLQMVESLLLRQAKLTPRSGFSMLGQDLPEFHYRNRILLHLNRAGELGYYRTGTGDVVDIERCLLAEQPLNDLILRVRPLLSQLAERVAAIKFERREAGLVVLLKPRERGMELNREIAALTGIGAQILHNEQDESDAGHFSQINSAANDSLVAYVLKQFADTKKDSRVTEFYAGAGNFTFPIALAGRDVTAIELDSHLTSAGERKAAELGLAERVSFITKSCEKFCSHGKISPIVLLDPPRAGAKIVAEKLDPKQTEIVAYVSCNPASLARDLRILVQSGFILDHVAVLDMFSQTAHVESIATLRGHKK